LDTHLHSSSLFHFFLQPLIFSIVITLFRHKNVFPCGCWCGILIYMSSKNNYQIQIPLNNHIELNKMHALTL
jgi:hypothetical protein